MNFESMRGCLAWMVACSTLGCMVEAQPGEGEQPLVDEAPEGTAAQLEQPIMNGTLMGSYGDYYQPAAVMIKFSVNDSWCSGALIGPNALVTAAHCIPGKKSGSHYVKVWQKTADGHRCVNSSSSDYNDHCTTEGFWGEAYTNKATAYVYPDYDPDDDDDGVDLAIVWMQNGWGAPANTSSSWLRIMASPVPGSTFRWYGWGPRTDDNQAYGYPRYGTGTVNFIWANTLYSQLGYTRTCAGDSGAPLIRVKDDTFPYNATYAVHNSNESERDGACGEQGDTVSASLLYTRLAWIESVIPVNCYPFEYRGFKYARCW